MIRPRPRRRPTPTSIGPYRILEELGRGGQGVVYLGQDASGARVAIKSVADDAPIGSPASERLRREAEILGVLDHPNIARVFAPIVDENRLYLVMEYVDGQPLSDRLRFGPLPRNDGLFICSQIALAIEAAHLARVVHRDLKPANIRITPDGAVKVLDFGVAAYSGAMAASGTPSPSTGQTGVVGTNGYMAPEQMMGGRVDHRADIWAFGCILYECLAGHPLFKGSSFDDVFLRVACRDADLRGLPGDLPRPLRVVLTRCLVRHPQSRLASIGEVTAILDSMIARRLPAGQRPGELGNLPRRPNAFVGREREMAEIASHLRFSNGVCITGPGGCGKTRLALEAASRLLREFRHGVWFVDLSDQADLAAMVRAIGEELSPAVKSRRVRSGTEAAPESPEERLAEQLKGTQLLLVLDQCDLLGPALQRLCSVLQRTAPGVRFLMTSREQLRLDGHRLYPLQPLPVPPVEVMLYGRDELLRFDSVRLFVERARQLDRGFAPDQAGAAAIADLCRRLEGLPLAVELASARGLELGASDLAERLDSVRSCPHEQPEMGTPRPRHATLDACIGWSFDLLTREEGLILTRLSVFRGGWTLEAAEAVCSGGDPPITPGDVHVLLTRLINRSLISYDAQTGRYSMLESVKTFAMERLGAAEKDALREAHCRYFRAFAVRAEKQLGGHEQVTGLRAIHSDLENLDAAVQNERNAEDGLATTAAISWFWYLRSRYQEGRRWLERALEAAPGARPMLICKAKNALGVMAYGMTDHELAEAAYRESLAIAISVGDKPTAARLWDNVATICTERDRLDEAEAAYQAALNLYAELGDRDGEMRAKLNYSWHHIRQKMYDRTEALCNECIAVFRANGDRRREATALHNLGEVALSRGEFATARARFIESLRIKDELGNRKGVSLSLYHYALALIGEGAYLHATILLAKSLEIQNDLGALNLPVPKPEHDRALALLTSQLGPEQFADAWNRGRELYDEDAVQTVTAGGAATNEAD